MPLSRKYTTIAIKHEIKERLVKKHRDGQLAGKLKGVSLTAYINSLLLDILEQDDYLNRYGPFLSWIGPHENLLLLYDNRLQRTVEVEVHYDKKVLHCREHNSNECLHVGFCFAIRDVYKVLVERGFRQPKVKEA